MTYLTITIFIFSCREKPQETTKPKNTVDTEIEYLTKQIENDGLNGELRFKRAKILAEKEDYEAAIEDLRVAIINDSLQPQYYHLLSDVFMDSNNSNKSLQTMEIAASLFPERIPTLLKLAETHYIIKQYQASIGVLNDIIRIEPQNGEAYFMLGLNFRALGDETRAINALQVATEFDSKIIDAWIILSEIAEKKSPQKALDYLEAAKNIEPNNVNVLHSMAFYHQNHNNIPKALELYRVINGIDKNYGGAYLNAGILYIELDSLPQAKERFDILIAQNPLNPVAYYYRGYTNKLMGNKDAAKADLKNAISLKPDYKKAISLLSTI
jgi:tetratricopeptide (TPR) repeat protein